MWLEVLRRCWYQPKLEKEQRQLQRRIGAPAQHKVNEAEGATFSIVILNGSVKTVSVSARFSIVQLKICTESQLKLGANPLQG
uniref:Uncharacterized protein n=1 Tax=Romanomermis culicivorax TaxID=13658 RepID=A0A915HZ47_ROMCU